MKLRPNWNWMPLTVISLACWGCVSQGYVDRLETVNRRHQEQILELQARLEDKDAEIEAIKGRNVSPAADPQLSYQLAEAEAERERLRQALALAEDQLRSIGTSPVLEPELDTALVELARSNPQLISYDPQMGMVKFQSDLTFALGSTQVNANAITSLKKLAAILNTQVAGRYEARIVGHTDNVPVNRPATRAKHPTNWHLSVHRAISVKNVLTKAGVDPVRIGVAGYGEHRPIVSNNRKGSEANRRVEIYLVPNVYGSTASSTTTHTPPPPVFPSSPAAQQPLALPPAEPKNDDAQTADAPEMFK